MFLTAHDPTRRAHSVQYRSAVFYRTAEERDAALVAIGRIEAAGVKVRTALEPFDTFWPAEDYHQKYYWRQFATRWEHNTAEQAPRWDSREFAQWLTINGMPVSVGLSAGGIDRHVAVGSPGYADPEERILSDLHEGLDDLVGREAGASVR